MGSKKEKPKNKGRKLIRKEGNGRGRKEEERIK